MTLADTCLASWSRTQHSVALSSAEAEYMALVCGAQEGLQTKSLASELGLELDLILESDASAALAAAEKQGVLKFKHLAIRWLFLKELVDRKAVVLRKVKTEECAADFLTKPLSGNLLRRGLYLTGGFNHMEETQVNLVEADFDEEEDESSSHILLSLAMATLMLAIALGWNLRYLMQRAFDFGVSLGLCRSRRSVVTQTPMTYTWLRGVANPRFTATCHGVDGAFVQDDA